MSEKEHYSDELKWLESKLEIYGADRARWPDDMRLKLEQVIEADSKAQELYEQAQKLDQALFDIPAPQIKDAQIRALEDLIIAQIQDKPNAETGAVLPFTPKPKSPHFGTSIWRSATVMAASLTIGIFLGYSGYFSSTYEAYIGPNNIENELAAALPLQNIEDGVITEDEIL